MENYSDDQFFLGVSGFGETKAFEQVKLQIKLWISITNKVMDLKKKSCNKKYRMWLP